VRDLVAQANSLGSALEGLADENAALRQRTGLPPGAAVDASGVRLAREVALAQLRSVNALLERQVRERDARGRAPLAAGALPPASRAAQPSQAASGLGRDASAGA
jgi:hypothetical protein